MKTYITDSCGFVHMAANSVGDHGESRGVFNSEDWFNADPSETPEAFFRRMTGEEPVIIETEE